jgi:hypothetical protein
VRAAHGALLCLVTVPTVQSAGGEHHEQGEAEDLMRHFASPLILLRFV